MLVGVNSIESKKEILPSLGKGVSNNSQYQQEVFQRFTEEPKYKHATAYLAPTPDKQLGHGSVLLEV